MPVKVKADKLTSRHNQLTHSDNLKVLSHVQRQDGEWIINTIMVEGHDTPFRYKRKTKYKNIQGQRVNMTYYRETDTIAGLDFEFMKVVRIKVS